jgi:hypothetical protein
VFSSGDDPVSAAPAHTGIGQNLNQEVQPSYTGGYGFHSQLVLSQSGPIWNNRRFNERPTTMQRTLFGKHATFFAT